MQAIDKACEVCERSPADPEVLAALGQGWVAEEALAISLYCAMSAPDAEHSLLLAVGARYGIQVFPERWLEQVELGDVLLSMADDLFEFPGWDLEDEAIEEQISKRYPGF